MAKGGGYWNQLRIPSAARAESPDNPCKHPVNKTLKRRLILLGGWGFVALGVAGLLLPFLQGILFLLIGIAILATEYAWARWLLRRLRERFPSLSARIDGAKERSRQWIKRFPFMKSEGSQD